MYVCMCVSVCVCGVCACAWGYVHIKYSSICLNNNHVFGEFWTPFLLKNN